jgi:hypothetical protein
MTFFALRVGFIVRDNKIPTLFGGMIVMDSFVGGCFRVKKWCG